MIPRSVRLLALGTISLACASAMAPAAQAEDFLSALFGGFGGRSHDTPPMQPMPFANEGDSTPFPPQNNARSEPRPAVRQWAGLLCTNVRRTLLPDLGDRLMKARLRPATVSVRRVRPRWFMAAASTVRRPKPASLILNYPMRFVTATSWSPDVLATARTRPGWRRSKSKMIRRFAKVTSSPARTG